MKSQIELEAQIIDANGRYRLGNSIMSDQDYDSLVLELSNRFPNSVLLKKGIIEKGGKEKLPIRMAGLNKVHSLEEISNWLYRVGCSDNTILILSPKLDGCSILERIKAMDKYAWTRGDGEYGTNVTSHFSYVPKIEKDVNLYFYGEAIIPIKTFEIYKDVWKQANGESYANARNAVASFFNTNVPQKDKLAEVSFLKYGVRLGSTPEEEYNKNFQLEICNRYNEYKIPFSTAKLSYLTENILDQLYNEWKSFGFEIDGIVIDINDHVKREEIGLNSNGNPNYAVAYKKDWEEVKETTINEIRWQPSRYGKLTPVAGVDVCSLEGGDVTSVTLYNIKNVVDKGIDIGCKIKLRRSGGVIPEILEVINPKKVTYEEILSKLKEYYGAVELTENKVDVYLIEMTWEQRIKQIEYFFITIGVEGFKAKSVEAFCKAGYDNIFKIIEHIIHTYDDNSWPSFVEGFRYTSYESLYNQLSKLKSISIARLQDASGLFPGFGEKTLSEITFEIDPNFLADDKYFNESKIKLLAIPGFGKIIVEDYLYILQENKYEQFFSNLVKVYPDLGVVYPWTKPMYDKLNQVLRGQKVVFSGFRDKELEQAIIDRGGEVMNSLSNFTTLVIAKNINSDSSKVKKALEVHIPIMSKEDFISNYEL